jgi:hypothetical protein
LDPRTKRPGAVIVKIDDMVDIAAAAPFGILAETFCTRE